MSGQHQSIGGEAHRDGGPSPNWGGRQDGWDQGAKETPAAPASTTETKPSFTADELVMLDEAQADTTDRPPLDDDDRAEFAAKVKAGFTPIEAAKHMGLTSAELAELQGSAPATRPAAEATSRADIDKQLAALRSLRTSNPRAYWSDSMQKRELSLLQALSDGAKVETTKAEPATQQVTTEQQPEPEAGDAEIAALDAELEKNREAQRTARGAELDRLEARELEIHAAIEAKEAAQFLGEDAAPLITERWREAGGVQVRFQALADNVKAVKGMLGDQAEAFAASLDALPLAVRVELLDNCSVADGNPIKQAEAAMRGLSGADLAAAQAWLQRWKGAFEGAR
jgi:hypothetical protein